MNAHVSNEEINQKNVILCLKLKKDVSFRIAKYCLHKNKTRKKCVDFMGKKKRQ